MPNLGLRALVSRELPHSFNSETLSKLEKACVPRLNNTSTNTSPPANPVRGDAYYVTTGSEGTSWEGVSESVAAWTGGGWTFIPLKVGFYAYIISDGTNKSYLGTTTGWAAFNDELVISKTFNEIYGAEDFLGNGQRQPAVQNIGAFYTQDPAGVGGLGNGFRGWWAHWSGSFGVTGIPQGQDVVLGQEQTFYPVFRYTGQKFRAAIGGASMPSVLSGRITAQSLISGDSAPIEIVYIPAEHPEPTQPIIVQGSGDATPQYFYESICTPAQVIAQLPGIQNGVTYSEDFSVNFQGDAGSVGFRFQDPCVVAALGHPFGEPHAINMTVEMTVSSAF